MSAFLDAIRGRGMSVAPFWRVIGAGLVFALAAAINFSEGAFNTFYRIDARLTDQWQRLSDADEPSGEVVVVGIDGPAIREKGRWPWGRGDLAELVERIAAENPRSITLDILLTEPGPYSDVNLLRTFRAAGSDVIALRTVNPDAELARALTISPVALAVAGGGANAINDLRNLTLCADPDLMQGDDASDAYVECLLLPLPQFRIEADAFAVTYTRQDLDGIVRRGSAFVAQPYLDDNGQRQEDFFTAMPIAALTACADENPKCPSFDLGAMLDDIGSGSTIRLTLERADGASPPPLPLTSSLDFWMDFGALAALSAPAEDQPPTGAQTVSAAAVFLENEAELARLTDRHVFVGLTRIGAIDQHTTPMSLESGVPGVVIQALAADNILAGRALAAPGWARSAVTLFLIALGVMALARFLMTSAPALAGLGIGLIAAPLILSWFAFEFSGLIVGGATPAIGAFLAVAPVLYGRIAAIRRELATARESQARDEERMDAARSIQLGSLPFAADFTDKGFETSSICRPAQEVGGDFFELFELSDGRLFAAVGDVSGKGLEASLVTALSKSISGAVTDRVAGPLGDAFREVSREFVRQAPRVWREEKGGFVTLVAARIDPKTGAAEFACAGCEPPTVIAADGTLKPVALPDVAPLGWIEDATFETFAMTLDPGDTIIMFTDGVTEAETPDGELYGQERAERTAADCADGAERMVDALEASVLSHQAGGAPTDDTTILAVTWRGLS